MDGYSETRPARADALTWDMAAFDRQFLAGLCPDAPLIGRDRNTATIGGCFALHLAQYLRTTDDLVIESEFLNSFVVREAFEIAFGERIPGADWRPDDRDWMAGHARAVLNDRSLVKRALAHSDAYVVTLGLAEVWFDKADGTVFPRGLTIDQYDPARHGFRISTLEENVANIARIRNIVRKHRGDVPLIFTLSPVPLSAAFRPISWVAANTVSKSVLRLAIDRLCTVFADDPMLFYFPAYEIVTGYFAEPFGEDMRHVRPEVVDFVMKTFERTYLRP